jgi:hypothetical protein
MNRYHRYHIKETDRFDANDFPKVQVELDDILKAAENIPAKNKEEIVMAYLKDHALEKEVTDSSPELSRLLTGGTLVTTHIEALFESCQANKPFLRGYEEYIREILAQPAA